MNQVRRSVAAVVAAGVSLLGCEAGPGDPAVSAVSAEALLDAEVCEAATGLFVDLITLPVNPEAVQVGVERLEEALPDDKQVPQSLTALLNASAGVVQLVQRGLDAAEDLRGSRALAEQVYERCAG